MKNSRNKGHTKISESTVINTKYTSVSLLQKQVFFYHFVGSHELQSDYEHVSSYMSSLFEPRCEKTGPTQTGLYNQRWWLEA